MKKTLVIFIFIIFSCSDEKFYTEYHSNGNLALKIAIDDKGIQNGKFEEYYENGKLKTLGKYVNGEIIGAVSKYYPSGKIKEKGIYKNGHRQNWWNFYAENNKLLRREEYYELRDSAYLNQIIVYNLKGEIDNNKSSYFILSVPDTIFIGKNKAKIGFYNSNKKANSNLITIVIDNQYSETKIRKDTFSDGTLTPFFGIYAYKEGKLFVKGEIEEKVLKMTTINKDSADLEITNLYKYFEKEIYVKKK